jgi:hypothetical protein
LATARTITRFGRTFVEFDPDGTGGGPPTWILGNAGPGASGGASSTPNGLFTPATASAVAHLGTPLFYRSATEVDIAQAIDGPAGGPHPYEVAGLANAEALNGQPVGLISDGQMVMADWTQVTLQRTLDVGKRYFLDATGPGLLTSTCPSGAGSTVVVVGQAMSPTTLEIEINVMVRL